MHRRQNSNINFDGVLILRTCTVLRQKAVPAKSPRKVTNNTTLLLNDPNYRPLNYLLSVTTTQDYTTKRESVYHTTAKTVLERLKAQNFPCLDESGRNHRPWGRTSRPLGSRLLPLEPQESSSLLESDRSLSSSIPVLYLYPV